MKLRLASACVSVLLTSAGLAHAEEAGTLHAGAELLTAPGGDMVIDADGVRPRGQLDLAPSFGVDLHVDYSLSPVFRVGLGQRTLFPISLKYGDADSGFQTDTVLRAVIDAPVTARVSARVRLSAGYSFISLPDAEDLDQDGETAELSHGFIMGLASGAAYQLTPAIALVGELGYSWGFQSASVDVPTADGTTSVDVRASTNLVHVGAGVELSF